MLKYDTLLDLARQRLSDLSRSPNRTRRARHTALAMRREVETELRNFNEGRPTRALFRINNDLPVAWQEAADAA